LKRSHPILIELFSLKQGRRSAEKDSAWS